MKNLIYLFSIMFFCAPHINAQQGDLEVIGTVKVGTMLHSNSDSIVVWNSDGTLGKRSDIASKAALEAMLLNVMNSLSRGNETFTSDTTGTVRDVDGNIYNTVKVGPQWWMAENLRTTKYSDGSAIDSANSATSWTEVNANGKWCWYDGDSTTYGVPYGKLYNWYAVEENRGLCPSGWHVPGGDSEWQTLETYLSPDAGLKMKSTSGWNSGGNGDNTSGFSGLPGGVRNGSGTFGLVGYYGYWWNSSQYFQSSAWGHGLYYLSDYVDRSLNNKDSGMSVRCLRD